MKYTREKKIALQHGVLKNIEKLEKELLKIENVSEVDFDLDGFNDCSEIVILIKYSLSPEIPMEEYFLKRKKIISDVLNVAKNNGLRPSGDNIEDYGEHFYFVMSSTWVNR